MGKFIPQLPDAGPLDGSELIPCEQSTTTVKTTTGAIAALVPPPPPSPFVQSGALAFNSAAIDVSGFTGQLVPFDQVSYDTDGYYLSLDGVFTAPAAGIYHFSGWAEVTGSDVGSGFRVELTGPAGASVARFGSTDVPSVGMAPSSGGGDYQLAGGDTVGFFVACSGTDAQLDGAFSVHAVGGLPTVPPPVVYLEDNFVDANGTLLDAHTMDVGPGWTFQQGTFEIQSTKATPLTYVDNDIVTSDAGQTDYTLTCVMRPTDDGVNGALPGIVVRFVDLNNLVMISFDSLAGSFTIYEKIAGTYNLRDSASVPFVSGTGATVAIVLLGTSISATVNGGSPISYGALTVGPASTLCGLRLGLAFPPAAPAARPTWASFLCTSS